MGQPNSKKHLPQASILNQKKYEIFFLSTVENWKYELSDLNVAESLTCDIMILDTTLKCFLPTVENWKSELGTLNVAESLTYDVDLDGKPKNLKCKYCVKFQDKIKDFPNSSGMFIHRLTSY